MLFKNMEGNIKKLMKGLKRVLSQEQSKRERGKDTEVVFFLSKHLNLNLKFVNALRWDLTKPFVLQLAFVLHLLCLGVLPIAVHIGLFFP